MHWHMQKATCDQRSNCRACKSDGLVTFLDLGDQPLANALLLDPDVNEPRFPLALCSCQRCGMIQLTHVVDASALFSHYLYFSSVSAKMTEHFAEYAADVAERFVPKNGLIVEIGSNDGILLQSLINKPVRILGVDPAANVAESARKAGVPTEVDFFCESVGQRIRRDHGPASTVIANNVFAHIDDLDSVMLGIDALLDKGGVFVIETPYIVDFIENLEFDTVYHEHLSYHGVRALSALFERFGFEIFDVRHYDVHGGTVRIFVQRKSSGRSPVSAVVRKMIDTESEKGIFDIARLNAFAKDVASLKKNLCDLIFELKAKNKRIVGYGAPAKGNVLLNYCELGCRQLDYLIDATPAKQGLMNPGMHIPIRPPETLKAERPDYILMLAWNHKNEILAKEAAYRHSGGKFIIPIPKVEII